MLIALVVAIVLAQASPQPQPTHPSQPATAAPSKPAKPARPKMICEDEVEAGGILTLRVCRTPEQVEAERQAARRDQNAISDHLAACRGASC